MESVDDWWGRHREVRAGLELPFDRALAGGAASDRVGYAFASGYHEALRALIPSLSPDEKAGLCVTEEGGAHPRAIQATLIPEGDGAYRLHGEKRYASLAAHADVLLVAARIVEPDEPRPVLHLVRVPAAAKGMSLQDMPDMPFVPEIPHAWLRLDDVHVAADQVLPGDGYAEYIKPFRTVEDLHVQGALLGYLIRIARQFQFGDAVVARLIGLATGLRSLARHGAEGEGWLSPVLHVQLAGLFDDMRVVLEELEPHWAEVPEPHQSRWLRDRPLLRVAESARVKRTETAWQRLRESVDGQG